MLNVQNWHSEALICTIVAVVVTLFVWLATAHKRNQPRHGPVPNYWLIFVASFALAYVLFFVISPSVSPNANDIELEKALKHVLQVNQIDF